MRGLLNAARARASLQNAVARRGAIGFISAPMKNFRWVGQALSAAIVFAAMGTSPAHARDLTVKEKLSDLQQLVSLIRSGYGPLEFKAEQLRLDLTALHEQYAREAAATKSNGDFYYLIVRLAAEFRDSHFGAWVPTEHGAAVPFSTDLVEGRVRVDAIDRTKLPEDQFPFKRGDEVVAVDGVPADQLVASIARGLNAGFEGTARRRAAMAVTVRPGVVLPVPAGKVVFTLRNDAETRDMELEWAPKGEPIDEKLARPSGVRGHGYDLISSADQWSMFERPELERSFRCSGATRITVPEDATIVMQAPFVAYYHPTPRGNVGYLRIPHYMPEDRNFALRFAQYQYAVSVLEANTVGLIIDQDHNCGGSVSYLHDIASLFLDRPVAPMQFSLLASKQEYLAFRGWLGETSPFTLEYQNLAKVLGLIETSWRAGEFMTPRTSIFGDTKILPNAVRYTHPIVMLIDELSGSGGDAFPALLQGNGRAKLLGTRTMGAGGHVQEQPELFYSRIRVHMTKSLFYRPDGVAVENNGAVPDIAYTITKDDFANGYKGYQAFYLEKLRELLPL